MAIIQLLLKEIEQEAQTTRKILRIVPDDHYDWKPHPKSMSVKQLTNHIAELAGWVTMAFTLNGLDFAANPYQATTAANTADVLEIFENTYADGHANLQDANDDVLQEPWVLRNGEHILANMTRYETVRIAIAQTIHHRAQLGVYLRLLNIAIPGSYGPSADEQEQMANYA